MHKHNHKDCGRTPVPYRDMLVRQVDLVVKNGDTLSANSLLFDDLTVGEMKRDGFCGPVYLKDADGVIHECELTAGNPEDGDLEGDLVKGLVFRLVCPRESGITGASVVRYSFSTCPPKRIKGNRPC